MRPDGDGWVIEREPEFSASDVAALLAAVDAEQVNSLGIPISEAYDPANKYKFEGYTVIDFAQAAVDRHRETIQKQYPDSPMHGVGFAVRLKE